MKKTFSFVFCIILLLSLFGCGEKFEVNDLYPAESGVYLAEVENPTNFQPYLSLNLEENTFIFGFATPDSSAEVGTFEVKDNLLTATAPDLVFVFEIKNPETLVLIQDGAENKKVNTEFNYLAEEG